MKAIFTTPLIFALLSQASLAQEKAAPVALANETASLLAKGNTWIYNVTLNVPEGGKFKPEFDIPAEKTPSGTLYKFSEKQVSQGLKKIESLNTELPLVEIFIENKLKKKQVLNFVNKQLHYHGTFIIDVEDPTKKIGYITVIPIVLHDAAAKIGEKWSWSSEKMPRFEFRIVSKKTQIEVLGRTYVADKIRMDQVDKTTGTTLISKEYWFTEGIGIVKEQEKNYTTKEHVIIKTLELKEFKSSPKKQ